MNCDRKPILQSQQSDIFSEKHNSARIFCQIFPALPDSDGHVCRLLFFSAASCLPLSIVWSEEGLVGWWAVGTIIGIRYLMSAVSACHMTRPFLSSRAAFSIFFGRLVTRLSSTGIKADLCQFEIISQVLVPAILISPPSFDIKKKSLKPNKYWLAQTKYWQAVF